MKESKLGKVNVGFDTFKLKDVFTKNDAGEWGGEPDENAIGVIRSTNFNNNGILDLSDVAYRTLKPSKKKEKLLEINDILIERSGGSDTQPVGRVGLITKGILKEEFAFANFIQRIAVDESINSTYLFYCLQQMYEMGITTGMQNQTTGIRNLDWKLYSRTVLPKPSKPEQTAIASMLLKVDKAIENIQNSIKAAEKLKKALMQNLLTGKMKPDGTFRIEDEFYIDEKYGKIPIGWSVKTIEDLANRKTDTIDPLRAKDVYDYIGLEHIVPNEFIREGKGKSDETLALKIKFNQGDLLYGKLRPYLNKVWIADLTGVGSTEFIVLEKNSNTNWIYLNLQSKKFLDHSLSMTAGTQHPRASWRDMKRFLISIPEDINEQKKISEMILSLESKKKSQQLKIQTLERLKKSLMQNLLTGKKRLSQEIINKLTQEIENI